jgi:bacillithiol biosynthesis deacetylase BshB1
MKLDILAFAAHPDDIELACSGTLIKHIKAGYKAGVVDLTRGELGTRGSAESRDEETKLASTVLGIHARENLRMKDGFFKNDEEHQRLLIRCIRKYQPEIIFCNAVSDRHIDHGRGAALQADACFLSGLSKIETFDDAGNPQLKWRPRVVYHYIQDYFIIPDIVVDITSEWGQKMKSIECYKSQFYDPDSTEPVTPIATKDFLEFLPARAMDFGRIIGAKYGEGFTVKHAIGVNDLINLR